MKLSDIAGGVLGKKGFEGHGVLIAASALIFFGIVLVIFLYLMVFLPIVNHYEEINSLSETANLRSQELQDAAKAGDCDRALLAYTEISAVHRQLEDLYLAPVQTPLGDFHVDEPDSFGQISAYLDEVSVNLEACK